MSTFVKDQAETSAAARFAEDGVVLLRGALDAGALAAAEAAYEWSLAHPGPRAKNFATDGATFYQDFSNPDAVANYGDLFGRPALTRIARQLWGDGRVWFLSEQVFLKEGGQTAPTPWHQDSLYMKAIGEKLAVLWINFAPIPKADSLEFVVGSHRGPTFSSGAFDKDKADQFPGAELPRLPDIEADRGAWDITSFAVEPGDVVAFHPAILHGGAATCAGSRRRTLSVRLYGDDVTYRQLPWAPSGAGPTTPQAPGLDEMLQVGDPLRHPALPQLNPDGGAPRAASWGD